jgi:hypothetical protein
MKEFTNGMDDRSEIRKPTPKKYYSWNPKSLSNPKSLIKRMKETVGEPKYKGLNQFSDSQVIEYLKQESNISDYIPCTDEAEKQMLNELSKSVLTLIQSRKRHHEEVLRLFKRKFSAKQLECIFYVYNGSFIINDSEGQTSPKDTLYEYLNSGNNVILNSEDAAKFISEIEEINPIVFDVFIDSIVTLSKVEVIEDLISYLKKTE